MKTLISKLVVIVAFVCATNVNAQNPDQFDAQLETTLRNVNSDDTASIIKGMDELKRIASQYPAAWLPTYYQTLFALQYAVRFPHDNHSSSFLEAAKTSIEALRTKPAADQSEVLTLNGFYYTALIVQNPAQNGQKYYMDAITNYKSAIGTNPANPRPRLLLYIFFENMSKATGKPSMNGPKDLDTIKQLFDQENKQGLQPKWGKELIDHFGLK